MGRRLAALALVAAALPGSGASQAERPLAGWLAYGNGVERLNSTQAAVRPGKPRVAWRVRLNGAVLTQPLVVRDLPSKGQTTVYFGTGAGSLYALSQSGRVRWRVDLGNVDVDCNQLAQYGVTGTPAIDPRTRALYVADARGRLHALDLVTGRERSGWPVVLYEDYRDEMVWGALLVTGGYVFVATGSYCDRGPMQGRLFRVSVADRGLRSWAPVPAELGGGGGIWGWGGLASSHGSIYVAPGNAFAKNEAAGYAEHLVELSARLRVRAANHPASIAPEGDVDFSGAPTVGSAVRCGRLVVVGSKNGRLYAWRAGAIRRGPVWSLDLRKLKPRYPLVTQTAFSARLRSVFVATGTFLVRVRIDSGCRPAIVWRERLPRWAYNGSPTVAGGAVWVGTTKTKRLLGFDARTGRRRSTVMLAGAMLAAPSVVGGSLYGGTLSGHVYSIR